MALQENTLTIEILDQDLIPFLKELENQNRIRIIEKGKNIDIDLVPIPKAHQELVMKRFNRSKDDPDRFIDWEEAKKQLIKK